MAFRTQKISQMTPKGSDLEATDLIEVSTIESGSYVTRSITGQELIDAIPVPPSGITIGTTAIASGVVGRVLFEGAGNVVQESANFTFDTTNNQLSLLTNSNQASSFNTGLNVKNTNSTGYANTLWYNDNNDIAQFMLTGTAGAISGTNIIARQASFINAGGTGGINLLATAGHITFLAGSGSTSKMVLFQTGNLAINTTTDAGFRLDVNGTARVSSNISGIYDGLNVRNSAGASNAQARIKFDNDITPTQTTTGGVVFYTSSVFSGFPSSSFGLWNYNSNGVIAFATNSTERLRIFSTGNVGINTTTDAGFRLDVNGTARVQNGITTTGADSIINTTTGLVRLQKNGADYVYINNDGFALRLLGSQVTMNPILGISIGALYDLSGNYSGYRGVNIRGTWTLNLSDTPDTSARLQVDSTTRGFLPPRMTTTQKNAIATPATGLQVFDTTLNQMSYYNGTTWTNI